MKKFTLFGIPVVKPSGEPYYQKPKRRRGAYFNSLIKKLERKYKTQGIWLYRRIKERPSWLIKVQGTKKDGYGYVEIGSGNNLEQLIKRILGNKCPACGREFKTYAGMSIHFSRCKQK